MKEEPDFTAARGIKFTSEYMKRPAPFPIERESVVTLKEGEKQTESPLKTPFGIIRRPGRRYVESETGPEQSQENDDVNFSIMIEKKERSAETLLPKPEPKKVKPVSKRQVKKQRASLHRVLKPVVSVKKLKSPRNASLKQVRSTLIELIDQPEPTYEPPLPTNVIWCSKQLE